jgi:hypothetical protein
METNVFNDLGKLDAFLHQEITSKMQKAGLDYSQALLAFGSENPLLMNLREALSRNKRSGTKIYKLVGEQLVEIENNIRELVRGAIKEHPELDYGEALKEVAAREPNLLRAREHARDYLG